MRRYLILAAAAALTTASLALAGGLAQEKRPEVTGGWTGIWGAYAPPPLPGEPAPEKPKITAYPNMKLDASVVYRDRKWESTFTGDAGGVFKYTVQMTGRQAGDVVLFQGTADLGEKGGGVYDWIGRATDKEFIGFYTSSRHTGSFRLARPN